MKILYLVHDVSDPAVARRVSILKAGGADLVIAGFRRSDQPVSDLSGSPVIDLGRSHDARLASRAALVLKRLVAPREELRREESFDLIVARNLEMLLLAQRYRRTKSGAPVPVVYECLDIHRLMLGHGPVSLALRGLERVLLKQTSAVAVSSPAFLRNYFQPLQGLSVPELLIENKAHVDRRAAESARNSERHLQPAPPIRIGWFGMIRCRRSFDILAGIARRGGIEVMIAGRPSPAVFPDFEGLVEASENVKFIGAYQGGDLPSLYGQVDLSWAIDFYEEGLNSEWLLPNRLYESVACGAIPIALSRTETGKYLAARGLGLVAEDAASITAALENMTIAEVLRLGAKVRQSDPDGFIQTDHDSRMLVQTLSAIRSRSVDSETRPK